LGDEMSNQNPHKCSDGGCVFLIGSRPIGMHTNSGCRCIPLRMTPADRARIRRAVRWLTLQIEKADAVLGDG